MDLEKLDYLVELLPEDAREEIMNAVKLIHYGECSEEDYKLEHPLLEDILNRYWDLDFVYLTAEAIRTALQGLVLRQKNSFFSLANDLLKIAEVCKKED